MTEPTPGIVAIVGPTAIGKSEVALELAQRIGADIVSADSRQIYRYMDICTAKPTPDQRSLVDHYMIDLVQPSERYSAQRYAEEAGRVLERVAGRRRVALVVGGTGFYIRALLDRVELPPVAPDPEFRGRLHEEVDREGSHTLHRRLAQIDPDSAGRVHPNNVPRLIRALEVNQVLGGPVPYSQSRPRASFRFALRMRRPDLDARADSRVLDQLDRGVIEETQALLDMGYGEASALQGLGYREFASFLRGEITRREAVERYQSATRRYIRRQLTWFGSDPALTWIDVDSKSVSDIADQIQNPIERAGRELESAR